MTQSRTSTRDKNLILIVPVWGNQYLETLEKVLLKSLILPRNFETLSQLNYSELRIVTDSDGAIRLSKSIIINKLKNNMKISILTESIQSNNKYYEMTNKYLYGINYRKEVISDKDFFLFLVPDLFITDGSLSEIVNKIAFFPVIQVMGFRIIRENLLRDIEEVVNFNKKEIINYVIANLHPICLTSQFNGDFNTTHPSHIYWITENTLIGHGFHLHPIAIKAAQVVENINKFTNLYTIDDWRFLDNCGFTMNDNLLVNDASILLIELTTEYFELNVDSSRIRNFSIYKFLKVLIWASVNNNTNKTQRNFFRERITISSTKAINPGLMNQSILKFIVRFIVPFFEKFDSQLLFLIRINRKLSKFYKKKPGYYYKFISSIFSTTLIQNIKKRYLDYKYVKLEQGMSKIFFFFICAAMFYKIPRIIVDEAKKKVESHEM